MKALLLLVVALIAAGCCRDLAEDLDPSDPDGRDRPSSSDGEVDLGEARFPPGSGAEPAKHRWWVPKLTPKNYRIGYRLADAEAAQIRSKYHGWARSVGHQRIDDDRFRWRPPRRCINGLHCVYEQLDEGSLDAVLPIADRFLARTKSEGLSSLDAAALAITFVQEITYRIPKEEPFGVKPPSLVVKEKDGDCDSKTLLAHMILRELGIESVLISSEAHHHTMLGVALPSGGTTFTHRGRRYAFVEMTAKRAPIGYVDPRLLRPNDWRVVTMAYKGKTPRAERAPTPPDAGKPKPSPQPPTKNKPPPSVVDIIKGGPIEIDR